MRPTTKHDLTNCDHDCQGAEDRTGPEFGVRLDLTRNPNAEETT